MRRSLSSCFEDTRKAGRWVSDDTDGLRPRAELRKRTKAYRGREFLRAHVLRRGPPQPESSGNIAALGRSQGTSNKPSDGKSMSDEVIQWLRAAATFGMAFTLALTIVACIKSRIARSKTPRWFIYNVLPINKTSS